MAKNASKKLAVENARTIRRLQTLFFGINGFYVVVRFLFFFSSVSWWTSVAYITTFIISLVTFQQLVSMGQPSYGPAGEVLAAGEDLSTSGLTSFMFDILYVTWFVHLGSLVSRYFWYFYLVIPGYCGVKIWGYLWPVVAGFLGRGSPGMTGPERSSASTQAQNGRARSARA